MAYHRRQTQTLQYTPTKWHTLQTLTTMALLKQRGSGIRLISRSCCSGRRWLQGFSLPSPSELDASAPAAWGLCDDLWGEEMRWRRKDRSRRKRRCNWVVTCLSGTLVTKYSPICCYSCASGQAATFTAQMVASSPPDAGFILCSIWMLLTVNSRAALKTFCWLADKWRADQGRQLAWRLMRVDRGSGEGRGRGH